MSKFCTGGSLRECGVFSQNKSPHQCNDLICCQKTAAVGCKINLPVPNSLTKAGKCSKRQESTREQHIIQIKTEVPDAYPGHPI